MTIPRLKAIITIEPIRKSWLGNSIALDHRTTEQNSLLKLAIAKALHSTTVEATEMQIAVKKIAVTALVFWSTVGLAIAGSGDTPGIDQRMENQQRRIDQGVQSGELTPREARRLETQQSRIENRLEAAKSDGVVTAGERARLTHQQNRASRNIFRKKHNLPDVR